MKFDSFSYTDTNAPANGDDFLDAPSILGGEVDVDLEAGPFFQLDSALISANGSNLSISNAMTPGSSGALDFTYDGNDGSQSQNSSLLSLDLTDSIGLPLMSWATSMSS